MSVHQLKKVHAVLIVVVLIALWWAGNGSYLQSSHAIPHQADPPGQVVLDDPSNAATGIELDPRLDWDDLADVSTGDDTFRIQIALDSLFTNNLQEFTRSGTKSHYDIDSLLADTEYFWRVRGENTAGIGPWSAVWRFTTESTPVQVVLSRPVNGDTGVSLEEQLRWLATPEMDSNDTYYVQVSPDSTFGVVEIDTLRNGGNVKLTVSGLSPSTAYFWRVQAENTAGVGPWSAVWSFTTEVTLPRQMVTLSPDNGTADVALDPTLVWQAMSGLDAVRVQVSQDAGFATIDQEVVAAGTAIQATVSGLQAGTVYYWQVRGENSAGDGPWSTTSGFSTVSLPSQIVALSPVENAVGIPLSTTFYWEPISGLDLVRLQVDQQSNFAQIDHEVTVSGAQDQGLISGMEAGSIHYWRVRGENSAGYGEWSEVRSFITEIVVPDSVVLASPADGSTGTVDSLTWQAAIRADYYNVQIATEAGFGTLVLDSANVEGTTLEVSGLSEEQTYYWRVQGENSEGTGPWSGVWSFNTNGPPGSDPSLADILYYTDGNVQVYRVVVPDTGVVDFSSLTQEPVTLQGLQASERIYADPINNYFTTVGATSGSNIELWNYEGDHVRTISTTTWNRVRMVNEIGAVLHHNANSDDMYLHNVALGTSKTVMLSSFSWGAIEPRHDYDDNIGFAQRDHSAYRDIIRFTLDDIDQSMTVLLSGEVNTGPFAIDAARNHLYWRAEADNRLRRTDYDGLGAVDPLAGVVADDGFAFSSISFLRIVPERDLMYVGANYNGSANLYRVLLSSYEATLAVQGVPTWQVSIYLESNVPSAPQLMAPGHTAVLYTPNPELIWETASHAESHHIQVSTDSLFNNIAFEETEVATLSVFADSLASETVYWWRVRGVSTTGVEGMWSEVWSFSIEEASGLEEMKLITLDGAENDSFGSSVASDGEWTIVGAPDVDYGGFSNSGAAYIFRRQDTTWVQTQKLLCGECDHGDHFGETVSIHGDRLAIGAPGKNRVWIFQRNSADTWIQEGFVSPKKDPIFGRSISIYGNHLLVGGDGSAWFFTFDEEQGKWIETAQETYGWSFGRAVSLWGDVAVVGQPFPYVNKPKSTYIYRWNGATWVREAWKSGGSSFGYSVAVRGDLTVVGEPYANTNTGLVKVLRYNGSGWSTEATLTASDASEQSYFGFSVALRGNDLLIGAPREDGNGTDAGVAYLFKYDGVGWSEYEKLEANSPDAQDEFGYHVALGSQVAFVGAFRDDDAASNAGAVYGYHLAASAMPSLALSHSWIRARLNATEQSEVTLRLQNTGAQTLNWTLTPGDAWLSASTGSGSLLPGARDSLTLTVDADTLTAGGYAGYLDVATNAPARESQVRVLVPLRVNEMTLPGNIYSPEDVLENDKLGYSVASDGDWAIVGASDSDHSGFSNNGAAYIYRKEGNAWVEHQKLFCGGCGNSSRFGAAVSMHGDRAAVGIPGENQAWLYKKDTTDTWVQEADLTGSDSGFGGTLSIFGNHLVVGSQSGTGFGTAFFYMYDAEQGTWIETATRTEEAWSYGYSVDLWGDVAIVSAPFPYVNKPKSAYIYRWDGETWRREGWKTGGSSFGYDVAIQGDLAVIGEPYANSNEGLVKVYRYNGSGWSQEATLYPSGGTGGTGGKDGWRSTESQLGDKFGHAVEIRHEVILVGAPYDDDDERDAGAVYMFRYDAQTATWKEEAKLGAIDAGISASKVASEFGLSVALGSQTALAGSPTANGADDTSGAFYVFDLPVNPAPHLALSHSWLRTRLNQEEQAAYELELLNTGTLTLDWALTPDQPWLTVSNTDSTLAPGARDTVVVTVNTDSLAVGAYAGFVQVTTNGFASEDSVRIPVPLRVNQMKLDGQQLLATDGDTSDEFGISVAAAGDWLVVGSLRGDHATVTNTGAVYVYKRAGNTWVFHQTLDCSSCGSNFQFGASVGVQDDLLVVGARSQGAIYIYRLISDTWTWEATIDPNYSSFGSTVDVYGNNIVVGNGDDGAWFYRYNENQSAWVQNANFGYNWSDGSAVAMGDSIAIVGRPYPYPNQSPSVRIYRQIDSTWVQDAYIARSDAGFGEAVAIQGDVAVVSAPAADSNEGRVMVFRRNESGSWVQETTLFPSGGTGGTGGLDSWRTFSNDVVSDKFGEAVALRGNVILVGAPNDDDDERDAGAVYVFRYDEETQQWREETKLTPFDAGETGTRVYDRFGITVALGDDVAVVGAPERDEVASQVGAAYAYAVDVGELEENEPKRYYYLTDHLGSVRATVNAAGTVVHYDDYYPFGMPMPHRNYAAGEEGEPTGKLGYTAHEQELDLDPTHKAVFYAGARYYDGLLGQWNVVDPMVDKHPGLSPYNYVANNPLTNIDPDGKDFVVTTETDSTGNIISYNISATYYVMDGDQASYDAIYSAIAAINSISGTIKTGSFFQRLGGKASVNFNLSVKYSKTAISSAEKDNGGNFFGLWSNSKFNKFYTDNEGEHDPSTVGGLAFANGKKSGRNKISDMILVPETRTHDPGIGQRILHEVGHTLGLFDGASPIMSTMEGTLIGGDLPSIYLSSSDANAVGQVARRKFRRHLRKGGNISDSVKVY